MSWLGTVDLSNVVMRGQKRVEQQITIVVGTAVSSVTTLYADATTYYWGGMAQTAAVAWMGTLTSATSPTYIDVQMDRVNESGEYGVIATEIGTFG